MWTRLLAVLVAGVFLVLPAEYLSGARYTALMIAGLGAVFIAFVVESRAGRFGPPPTILALILTAAFAALLFVAVTQTSERVGRTLAVSTVVAAILWSALRKRIGTRRAAS